MLKVVFDVFLNKLPAISNWKQFVQALWQSCCFTHSMLPQEDELPHQDCQDSIFELNAQTKMECDGYILSEPSSSSSTSVFSNDNHACYNRTNPLKFYRRPFLQIALIRSVRSLCQSVDPTNQISRNSRSLYNLGHHPALSPSGCIRPLHFTAHSFPHGVHSLCLSRQR